MKQLSVRARLMGASPLVLIVFLIALGAAVSGLIPVHQGHSLYPSQRQTALDPIEIQTRDGPDEPHFARF